MMRETMRRSAGLRVLMSADPIGGVWTYALDLAAGLHAYDVQVILATMGAPLSMAQRCAVGALPNVRLEESHFRLEWMPEPWHDVAAAGVWLLELARRHDVHLVHLNHLVHADLPFGVPVVTVAHACVLSWWESVRREQAPAYYDRYRREVRQSLQAAHTVITVTHAMARRLQRHYGPLPDLAVIRNGRRSPSCAPVVKAPRIFTAGRLWDEAKNAAAVMRVATHVPWPVYLAGADACPRGYAPLNGDAFIRDRRAVRMLGQLPAGAMEREYRRTAIYALPARYEPFGLSILEAAQAECALVLGDIDSLRELWDGVAVFLAPDDDVAMRTALRALIAEPARRLALGHAARQRATSFRHETFVQEYLVAYRTMLGMRSGTFDGVHR
ncbi:MAG: hypothetical protein RLZZ621_2301 [Gemmatimonadota bacterium]